MVSQTSQVGGKLYLAQAAEIARYNDGTSLTSFLSSTIVAINRAPANATDATNKLYVDTSISTLSSQLSSSLSSEVSRALSAESSLHATLSSNLGSSISVGISIEASTARSAEASLTTALSVEISNVYGGISALTSLTQHDISSLQTLISSYESSDMASLASEASNARSAEASLTTALSVEASSARSAEASLTSSVSVEASSARSAEGSLTSSVSVEASTARSAEASLTSSVSVEASTARSAEASLTSSVSVEASTARSAEVSLTSALSVEASTARSAELSLTTYVKNTSYRIVNCEILPLNNATIGGGGPTGCPPQYVPPNITSNNVPIDGWYFKNYDTNHKKIQWGYAFADQVGSYSLNLLTDVNQVYFSCYINKATTAGDSPFLVIYTYGTQNIYYKQAIKYVSSTNITTPGYYTFIANISGNSNIKPFVLGSANNANNIIELNYSTSSVPSGYNSLSAMNTASSLSAAY